MHFNFRFSSPPPLGLGAADERETRAVVIATVPLYEGPPVLVCRIEFRQAEPAIALPGRLGLSLGCG
jgi:hypothetical protein